LLKWINRTISDDFLQQTASKDGSILAAKMVILIAL